MRAGAHDLDPRVLGFFGCCRFLDLHCFVAVWIFTASSSFVVKLCNFRSQGSGGFNYRTGQRPAKRSFRGPRTTRVDQAYYFVCETTWGR
ncbi:hypothetical protein NDU88_007967 [Pleurodeles waltl]|uniref:Secreted protein n=1 Tax=Pleurodeles waltl TaxID=8319 RepID=A0AAV7N5L8_PLEWA|nr:hypothetical protein NDU88_007967 [Pleurodeles waltl]